MLNNPHLTIDSARGVYHVFIADSISYIDSVINSSNNVVLLIDENVARLHRFRLVTAINKLPVLTISANENNKSWIGVEQVLKFFLINSCNRNTKVIVIGGGIIQDISSFACHIFFRGIEWEFFPTTILSMADSCIGAKSGLNFENIKNLVGAFENPRRIVIDTMFANTLEKGDIYSGMGEIFKLALISGGDFFQLFSEDRYEKLSDIDLRVLILNALITKKKFIEQDEFDYGMRRILNYGHTFGHALEAVTQYAIPHGIAVVVGMDLVNFIAVQYGFMSQKVFDLIHRIIANNFHISTKIDASQIDELILAASKDKKRTKNGLNLVILNKPGEWDIKPFVLDEEIKNTIKLYFSSIYPISGSATS